MNTHAAIKPGLLALAALALGVLGDLFFLDHQWGIVVPIFMLVFLGAVVLFDRLTHRHLSWFELGIAALMMLLSVFFALRDSNYLLALDVAAMLYLGALLFVSLYGGRIKHYNLWDFVAFPAVDMIIAIVNGAAIFRHFKTYKSKQWARIGLGTILGLIALLIFGALFAAADEVFRVLLDRAFNFQLKDVLDDAFFIIALFVGFLLLFAPAFWKKSEGREVTSWHSERSIGVEATIILSVLNALFLIFVAIQAVYLFGGESNLSSLGLTYAEYARQGFHQLLVVAGLVVGLMWLVRLFHMGSYRVATNVLQSILVVLTVGVLASSWMRLSLYEQAFGFTRDRLNAHYFLVVIAAVLILFLIGLSQRVKQNLILRGVIIVFAVGLLGLNLLNPDVYIARKNVERGEAGYPVDLAYLVTLSEDAVPAIAEYADEHLDERRALYQQFNALTEDRKSLFRERNLACTNARTKDPVLCEERERQLDSVDDQLHALRIDQRAQNVENYDNWKNNFTYASDWQSWNLSRWRAKLLREQLP